MGRTARVICRHLPAICCTTVLILVAWMVITVPVVAVFLVDDAFVVSDYAKFILYAAVAGLGISAVILFPISLGLALLARKKRLLLAAPFVLPFVSAACLFGRFLLTGQFFDTVFGWAGLLFAFSLVFVFYWTVLLIGKTFSSVSHGFRLKAPL